MNQNTYVHLYDLEVYKLARELSRVGWQIYEKLDWQTKKIMGDQFIESTDSTGANIAEGYGRFHFLDKIKFYYNSRASLFECGLHWISLLEEREKVEHDLALEFKNVAKQLSVKLNNFITVSYQHRK